MNFSVVGTILHTTTSFALAAKPIPLFSDILPDDLTNAIEFALGEARAALSTVLRTSAPSTDTVLALEQLLTRLEESWSPLRHLHAVADTPAVRAAYEACLPQITAFHTEVGQSTTLYARLEQLDANAITRQDPALGAALTQRLRDMRLTGAALDQQGREKVAAIKAELAELQSTFSTNLLDASERWQLHITAESELQGLAPGTQTKAASDACAAGVDGWLFKLDAPTYLSVAQHAQSRTLREQLYTAWVTRASERFESALEFDNTALMSTILKLRHQLAKALRFESFAHYSLATKMAGDPQQVIEFLEELAARAKPVAQREFNELVAFAHDRDGINKLQAWDVAYYAERLRETKLGLDQKVLRPYFPMQQVLSGLFSVLERLFGVTVTENETTSAWHPDVRQFALCDVNGNTLGYALLDAYARSGKRGGAWMDECRARHSFNDETQLPVAYLSCNFTPPINGADAQLTHDEVLTLFHETGHGIHHLLTDIEIPSVGGINGVAWDAVELPSQLLENWCWAPAALTQLTAHVDSGEPLDPQTITQLRDARSFLAGMGFVRQLEFALFDMRLHLNYKPTAQPQTDYIASTLAAAREAVAVVPTPSFNRFENAFTHVFAGGYAAGYYSYKWAEVLASDAFAKFEETALFDANTGNDFRANVLARGGTEPADVLYQRFRGRAPNSDALLRHNGL